MLCRLAQIGKKSLLQPSKNQIKIHGSSSLMFAGCLEGCLGSNYIPESSKGLLLSLIWQMSTSAEEEPGLLQLLP